MTAIAITAQRIRGIDRVILAILGLFALIAVVAYDQLWSSVVFTSNAMLSILPFLTASVVIAGAAKATSLDGQIARVFKGHPVKAIVLASAFGATAPFCSCG
ncbi:MAG: permease, partial [Rhodospirillaceae bacterium]|nr:permease [Rhodospirillaceae bacterium]